MRVEASAPGGEGVGVTPCAGRRTVGSVLACLERRILFLPPTPPGEADPERNHSPDRMAEWMLACAILTWGAWLLNPAYATLDQDHYRLLRAVVRDLAPFGSPDAWWGGIAVAVGVARVYALWRNGQINPWSARLRLIGSLFGMAWWTLAGMLIASSGDPMAATIAWYPMFFVFEGMAVVRVVGDYLAAVKAVRDKAEAAIPPSHLTDEDREGLRRLAGRLRPEAGAA